MLDMRTDYLQGQSEQCLREILSGLTLEAQKLLLYEHMIGYCYRMLKDFAADLRQSAPPLDQERAMFNESMLFAVLKTMIKMVDKTAGMQAMRQFFRDQKSGSLTTLLLSFTGTSL
ncbi:hypothetical protein KR032_009422, partial [Drosophila birchii]